MKTKELIRELKKLGYIVSHNYIMYLIRDNLIEEPRKEGRSFFWDDEAIKSLCDTLNWRGRYKS